MTLKFDMNGVLIADTGVPAKRQPEPARPSAAARQAVEPSPLLDDREVLTLRQAAQVLGLSPDDAAAMLARESAPRIVGWERSAVEALRERERPA